MKEKGINLKINDFKNELANCISRSNLPPGVVHLGLEWALRQVEEQNVNAIRLETETYAKENTPVNQCSNIWNQKPQNQTPIAGKNMHLNKMDTSILESNKDRISSESVNQ